MALFRKYNPLQAEFQQECVTQQRTSFLGNNTIQLISTDIVIMVQTYVKKRNVFLPILSAIDTLSSVGGIHNHVQLYIDSE